MIPSPHSSVVADTCCSYHQFVASIVHIGHSVVVGNAVAADVAAVVDLGSNRPNSCWMARSHALSAGHSPGEASTTIDAAPQHQPAVGSGPGLAATMAEYSLAAGVQKTNPCAHHYRGYEPNPGGRPLLPQMND